MDKNAFLLYNEVVYHLHTCEDLEDLKRSLLAQVKLIIPCAYISLIEVAIDPDTRAIRHQNPLCLPESFREVEEAWIRRDHQDETLWVSHAPESLVTRGSELIGEGRLDSPIYRSLYAPLGIYDTMSLNLTYDHQVMALLSLYRTKPQGVFTDQDAFYLRALANHINYAYHAMATRAPAAAPAQSAEELVRAHGLTRREEEILRLVFQDQSNEDIAAQLVISRHTLLKHLQNIYRKCGVSFRWDLRRLGP